MFGRADADRRKMVSAMGQKDERKMMNSYELLEREFEHSYLHLMIAQILLPAEGMRETR